MDKDYQFLPYFIQEEIYLLKADANAESLKQPAIEREIMAASPVPEEEIQHAAEPVIASTGRDTNVQEELVESYITPINFLGGNKKNIMILINEPNEPIINTADKEFLTKILGAVALSLEDVAIYNYHTYSGNKEVFRAIAYDVHINFGLNQASLYQVAEKNGKKILAADSLALIQHDKQLKARLWVCLQQIFLPE